MNTLMIDGHNIAYRNLYPSVYDDGNGGKLRDDEVMLEKDFYLWRHYFMNSLYKYIARVKPDEMIVTFDKGNPWRENIYPFYKGGRDKVRQASAINFSEFYKVFVQFRTDLRKFLSPVKFIELPEIEADDTIAVLTKRFVANPDHNVTIISGDGDLHQLLKFPNVTIIDPNPEKDVIHCENPVLDLRIKIITGDKSDEIPNIKTIEGAEKKARLGPVGAKKIIEEGIDVTLAMDEAFKNNHIRNTKLIDFDLIPERIRSQINKAYDMIAPSPIKIPSAMDFDEPNPMDFFANNRLRRSLELWDVHKQHFNHLATAQDAMF